MALRNTALMPRFESEMSLVHPTPEQAEAIRAAVAEELVKSPERAEQLKMVESATLSEIGDGLPEHAYNAVMKLIRGDSSWQ